MFEQNVVDAVVFKTITPELHRKKEKQRVKEFMMVKRTAGAMILLICACEKFFFTFDAAALERRSSERNEFLSAL